MSEGGREGEMNPQRPSPTPTNGKSQGVGVRPGFGSRSAALGLPEPPLRTSSMAGGWVLPVTWESAQHTAAPW